MKRKNEERKKKTQKIIPNLIKLDIIKSNRFDYIKKNKPFFLFFDFYYFQDLLVDAKKSPHDVKVS